jgi:hypothetical protein
MRPRTLLILASLVAVLGAFIWFVERDLPSTEERAEQEKRVVRLDESDVDRVVIEHGGTRVELVRDAVEAGSTEALPDTATWRLVEPLAALADSPGVKRLVSRLVDLEKERTLEGVGRGDVGLASPRATVILGTGDGDTKIEVGADVPASSTMTLAVGGREEFYVVSNSIVVDLLRPAGEWRDLSLFVGERSEIERVVLRRQGEVVELVDRGSGFWIEAPLADRADEAGVNALLSEVSSLRAERFLEVGESDGLELGLESPEGSIEVHLAGRDQPWMIELGGFATQTGNPTRFARLGADLVTVAGELVTHLERAADQWRSRKWAVSKVLDITRAEVSDAGGVVEIRREGGDWLRDGERLSYGPATDLLYELTGAEAEGLETLGAFDPGEPEVTVRLESDLAEVETLELYAPREGQVPAWSSSREATLLLLTPEAAQGVTGKIEAVRGAELAPPDDS